MGMRRRLSLLGLLAAAHRGDTGKARTEQRESEGFGNAAGRRAARRNDDIVNAKAFVVPPLRRIAEEIKGNRTCYDV